jgi:hypothetical protein
MPTPRQGEKYSDFVNRCVPIVVNEGRAQDQAVAICHSIWRQSKRKQAEDNKGDTE